MLVDVLLAKSGMHSIRLMGNALVVFYRKGAKVVDIAYTTQTGVHEEDSQTHQVIKGGKSEQELVIIYQLYPHTGSNKSRQEYQYHSSKSPPTPSSSPKGPLGLCCLDYQES